MAFVREGFTPFQDIYDAFFNIVTDDMYLEWTKEETVADIKNILMAALPKFRYPRFKLYDYEVVSLANGTKVVGDKFNFVLTQEELSIFAHLMMVEWIRRQIATTDITRQKYGSKDFQLTSQANHLSKLTNFKNDFKSECLELQNLYKRRKIDDDGYVRPNFSGLGGKKNAN